MEGFVSSVSLIVVIMQCFNFFLLPRRNKVVVHITFIEVIVWLSDCNKEAIFHERNCEVFLSWYND